jgi:tetratricopeptide (TPR) repeat protein
MKPSSRAAGLVAVVLLGAGWLWWICEHDSGTSFLPETSGAYWILYPKPLDSIPHRVAPISTVFKRSFRADRGLVNASVSIRCFKSGSVSINRQAVPDLVLDGRDWKKSRTAEIGNLIRNGENEIVVTVSNSIGPPALWLVLTGEGIKLASDSSWQTSCLGAAWQNAGFAFESPIVRAGNPLFARERVGESLRKGWPMLLALVLLAVLICGGIRWVMSRESFTWPIFQGEPALAAIVVVIVLLAILFVNNLPQLAPVLGFDRDGHLQYIDYILQKKALPLADEGWQMYQPPLFYLLSALLIAPFGSSASTDSSVLALRVFCAGISVVHVVLIFLCLRLLFPKQMRHQLVGLAIGAFLPASLCLAHNITNESLAALFVTAALYFTLRSIQASSSSAHFHAAVGICLGLAMLTKFSALLAIPPICALLVWKGHQRAVSVSESEEAKGLGVWKKGLTEMTAVLVAFAVVCGWHYARVWAHFGIPLIGNWDPHLPFAWWQEPGYRVSTWYYRFGESFRCPLFSNLSSFADGLYSTLWGDGLCSGSARMSFRPQWNYELMNAGYLLALIPAVLMAIGLGVACVRLIRKPDLASFLGVSFIALYGAGILLMTLRVPSFAQVKAFYALPALLPICLLCLIGWDFLARRSAAWRPILSVGMVSWVIVVYGSLWLRPGNPFTHSVRGVGLADDGRYSEAAEEFSRALQLAPKDCDAYTGLLDSLTRGGNREEARRQAVAALAACPNDAGVEMQVGAVLGLDGKYEEAAAHFRRSIELAPDAPGPYLPLTTCLARLGQTQQLVEAAKEGLRVNPLNAELHITIAAAYASLGDLTNQVAHLRSATNLKPDADETLNNLAWILASTANDNVRNAAEAVKLAERACDLTQRREPVLLGTLAAAYAAAGRFKEAVETAEQARDKAIAVGQDEVAQKNRQLLELYRAGKAYRERISDP